MDLDDHLFQYFGTIDLSQLNDSARASGVERMLVDFGLSRDSSDRFTLWALLHMFDASPELDVAFTDPADRDAARNFMDFLARAGETSE